MEFFTVLPATFQPPTPLPLRYLPLSLTDIGALTLPSPVLLLHAVELVAVGPDRPKAPKLHVGAKPYLVRQVVKPAFRRAASCPPDPPVVGTPASKSRPIPRPAGQVHPSPVPPFDLEQPVPPAPPRRVVIHQSSAPPSRPSDPSTPAPSQPSAGRPLITAPSPVEEEVEEQDQLADKGEEEVSLDDELNVRPLIEKPPGEVGRPSQGGYNLQTAMGLEGHDKEYDSIKVHIFFIDIRQC
jgi:hypothetical protein